MQKFSTYFLFFFFSSLLIHQKAFGQKNFTRGYLLLTSQDTLSGFLDNQEWDHNPSYIDYKQYADSPVQRYSVQQLTGFGFTDGDIYRHAVVQVDKTPIRFEELLNNSKPIITTDTVFLLVLVKGPISLYHLLDEKDKNHFFIQKNDGNIEELVQRNFVTYKNSQPLLGTADQYKDQLKYSYLTDCLNLQAQIAKTSYTKAALSHLIQNYNGCLHPEVPTSIQPISKHENKFGLIAGVNLTNYKFKGQGYDYLLATQFGWKNNPMIGLFYQLLLPRNQHKWSIYNELAWKRNNTQGTFDIQDANYIYNQDAYYTGEGNVHIKTNYLGLTSMFRYSWMNKNWQPFFNFGLAGNLGLNINTYVQGQEKYKSENIATNKRKFENPSKYEVALITGGGTKFNNIASEIRLEKGSGYLNSNADVSVRKVMLAFLMTYYFN